MSKIQIKPSIPKDPPAPKKTPPASGAAPFTAAKPKPRQSAAPPATSATQSRNQPAKAVRQARAAAQAAPPEHHFREARTPDLTGELNAGTRFDSGNGMLPGRFFSEFTEVEETQDAMARGSAGSPLKEAMDAAALDDSLDCTALARLLPTGGNDGIFDVILPTGDRLGVVVSGQSSSLSYLLSPTTEKFGSRLRRNRMELEERLERLTHRNVNITVL